MIRKHPKLPVVLSGTDYLLSGFSLILAVASSGYLAYLWNRIESASVRGEAFILAAVMIGEWLLLTVVRNFPHTFNFIVKITDDNASKQYELAISMIGWLCMLLSAQFALLLADMVRSAVYAIPSIENYLVIPFSSAMLLLIGYYMYISWKNK